MVRRTTWVLLAALSLAVVLFLSWQRSAPARVEPTATAGPESPWTVTAAQVEALRLTDLTQPAVVVLHRDATEGWRMLAPALGGADVGRIEAALAGVLAPVVRQELGEAQDLQPFGLSPARFRVTLLLADGTARSMDVGDVDPTGSVYYATIPGDDRVLMVGRFSLEDLLGFVDSPPIPSPTATAAP